MTPIAVNRPDIDTAADTIKLPSAPTGGGLPLMEALSRRRSSREFALQKLPLGLLSIRQPLVCRVLNLPDAPPRAYSRFALRAPDACESSATTSSSSTCPNSA